MLFLASSILSCSVLVLPSGLFSGALKILFNTGLDNSPTSSLILSWYENFKKFWYSIEDGSNKAIISLPNLSIKGSKLPWTGFLVSADVSLIKFRYRLIFVEKYLFTVPSTTG